MKMRKDRKQNRLEFLKDKFLECAPVMHPEKYLENAKLGPGMSLVLEHHTLTRHETYAFIFVSDDEWSFAPLKIVNEGWRE